MNRYFNMKIEVRHSYSWGSEYQSDKKTINILPALYFTINPDDFKFRFCIHFHFLFFVFGIGFKINK